MTTPFYSWTTIGELSTAVVLILGACGGLLSVIFKGTGNSRCEDISVCCGCFACKRKPKTAEEIASEIELVEPREPDTENPTPIKKENIPIEEK